MEQADIIGKAAVLGREIAGNYDLAAGEKDHIEDRIENREQRALLRVVCHAALRGLCDDALECVADVIEQVEENKQRNAPCSRRNLRDKPEHAEARDREDDIAYHHERTVLAELSVGLVYDEADERVCHAVPDTHDHGEASRKDYAQAYPAGDVVH